MYGNGVVIGMVAILQWRKPIRQVPVPALTACVGVAVGTALRRAAVWLFDPTVLPAIAATPLGFA